MSNIQHNKLLKTCKWCKKEKLLIDFPTCEGGDEHHKHPACRSCVVGWTWCHDLNRAHYFRPNSYKVVLKL